MNWLILALVSVVSISIANIYQRVMMRDEESDPLASSIVFQFLLAIIIGIFALFNGFKFPTSFNLLPNFVFSMIFYAAGTLLLFKAIKLLEASTVAIISALGAVVTIILAILFLDEQFTFTQGFGVLLILAAILLVQGKIKKVHKLGLLYAIAGTTCYATALISDVMVLRQYDAVSYAVIMSFLPGLLLLISKPSVMSTILHNFKPVYIKNTLLYTGFYSIQTISYYMAIGGGANASQMAPITRSQIILTVLLSAIFLKERDKMFMKILSAALVTIGIFLIS